MPTELPVPPPDGPRIRARRRDVRAHPPTQFDTMEPFEWPPNAEDLKLIEVVEAATFRVVPVEKTSALTSEDLALLRRTRPERVPTAAPPMPPPAARVAVRPAIGGMLTAAGIAAIAASAYLSFAQPSRHASLESASVAIDSEAPMLAAAPIFAPVPLVKGTTAPRPIAAIVTPRSSATPARSALSQPQRSANAQGAANPQPRELHWLPLKSDTSSQPARAAATPTPTAAPTPSLALPTKIAPPALPSSADAPIARQLTLPASIATAASAPVAAEPIETRAAAAAGRVPAANGGEQQQIYAMLKQYEQAYERLDANAVRDLWPSVDARALARAFHDLKSQALVFDRCDVSVATAMASAACRGHATYETRVGQQASRTEQREWTFQFQKNNQAWRIVKASASAR